MPTNLAATAFEHLLTEEIEPGIVLVTLNRPAKLNAIDRTLWDELHRLCAVAESDEGLRVVILTGAGRGFCAGADLTAITRLPDDDVTTFLGVQEWGAAAIARVKALPVPVIAAVNGPAAGGGLALALAADVRLAAPPARFNVAFIRLGLSGCDVGVSWLLPRVVGLGHASELMLTGRLIDADEAFRIGLANRVVVAEDLLDTALELAREIAANSPFALRLTKEGLQLNVDSTSIESAIALENRNQVLASRTQDARIAMDAFTSRTAPTFVGR